jgi:hypothetical protein
MAGGHENWSVEADKVEALTERFLTRGVVASTTPSRMGTVISVEH